MQTFSVRRVVSVVDELERTFILPLAPRWVRHSYLSKSLHMIPYTYGISSATDVTCVCILVCIMREFFCFLTFCVKSFILRALHFVRMLVHLPQFFEDT
jgi:hypothetical protein